MSDYPDKKGRIRTASSPWDETGMWVHHPDAVEMQRHVVRDVVTEEIKHIYAYVKCPHCGHQWRERISEHS